MLTGVKQNQCSRAGYHTSAHTGNTLSVYACIVLPAPSPHHTPGIPSRPASVGRSSLSRSHTPRSRSWEPLNRPMGDTEGKEET